MFSITVREQQRICHVAPNKNPSVFPEVRGHNEYLQKLRMVTKINLNNNTQGCFAELVHPEGNGWIKSLCKMDFDLACVWFEGTFPTSSEFEDELLKLVDGEWKHERWMVAGHILNHENRGRYPHWHHQVIVINLKEFAKSNPPLTRTLEKRPRFKASEENFHDDYTPFYLDPLPDASPGMETRSQYLDSLIPNSLKLGYRVYNLPQSVRDHKFCIYAEDNIEETEKWLLDPDFLEGKTPQQRKEFGHDLDEDKMELYGLKNQSTQVLYITNTESIPKDNATPVPFTQMFLPCSGLNQFWHLERSLDTLQTVNFFDFNPYAIKWTKKVIEEYDPADNFTEFYENNIMDVIGDEVIDPACCIYDEDLYLGLVENFGGQAEWERKINAIKKLSIDFVQLDAVKEWSRIAKKSGYNHNLFINLTNIWQYEINYLNTNGYDAQYNFMSLIQDLNNRHNEVFMTGNVPSGIHYTYQNMKIMTGIA